MFPFKSIQIHRNKDDQYFMAHIYGWYDYGWFLFNFSISTFLFIWIWISFVNEWMNESCSIMSYSLQPHGLEPVSLLCPWNSQGKNPGMGKYMLSFNFFKKWSIQSESLVFQNVPAHWITWRTLEKFCFLGWSFLKWLSDQLGWRNGTRVQFFSLLNEHISHLQLLLKYRFWFPRSGVT